MPKYTFHMNRRVTVDVNYFIVYFQIDFMPNVFSALAYRPDQLRVFLQYHEIVMAERGKKSLKLSKTRMGSIDGSHRKLAHMY